LKGLDPINSQGHMCWRISRTQVFHPNIP